MDGAARWIRCGTRVSMRDMEYTHLGRTGTSVSRIVLGTMNFGDRTSEEDSFAILDRAHRTRDELLRHGERLRRAAGRGATEEIIGRWFASRPGVRDDIVLATKVHSPMVDPTPDGDVVNARGASAWQVRREAIGSLKRLQTDRIDLYQFHHIDRHISWPELWQAMEVLVARGEVIYTGSSNFAAWNIAQANEIAQQRHFLGLVSEQSLYNLASAIDRTRGHPGCAELRSRHPALVAARRRTAQRRLVRPEGALGPRH